MTDPSQLLPVTDGRLLLDDASFGPVMADALARLTGGHPIIVTVRSREVNGDTVTVKGIATLLRGQAEATVTASADTAGASLVARFELPAGWRFSASFPRLPEFDAARTGVPASLLDRLPLSRPAFLISTAEGSVDPMTGAELKPGVSFAAGFGPARILSELLPIQVKAPALAGPVVIPLPAERTQPLPSGLPMRLPWQTAWRTPGITLACDIADMRVGPNLTLSGAAVSFYSPTDREWLEGNPSYAPIVAGTAKLAIPSAAITADVTVLGVLNPSRLSVSGAFTGLNLAKLADLADAVGGTDLPQLLPGDIQERLGKLGGLGLLAATLDLGPGLAVRGVSVAVGIPDLNTTVLPGFQIDSLVAGFAVSDPFGTNRAVSVTVGGRTELFGAPFDVELAYPEVSARATLARPVSIDLGKVAGYVGLEVPTALPNLTVDSLSFYADKAGTRSFAMEMAHAPAWTIDLGPTTLTIADVEASITRPAAGSAVARFGGRITLAGVTLGLSYETPGNFLMRSEIPEVSLLRLARELTGDALGFVPSGFDVTLLDSVVMIRKTGADLGFLLATNIDGLGWIGFEARKASGRWGFAFGLDLVITKPLSDLPGLGGLKPLLDVFRLKELLLVLASFEDPGFQFVPASAFDTPALPSGAGVQVSGGGVIKGFNAYGRWTLDLTASDQKLLGELLGLESVLQIVLQVGASPAQNSALFLSIDTTLCGMPLAGSFGGRIQDGNVSLFIDGELRTSIGGGQQRWTLSLQVLPNGVLFAGAMRGTVAFEGLQLSDIGLVIGCDWEGIPSIGVTGSLTTSDFHSSLAVFLNSADPAQSLLAGSVRDLTLADVIQTIAGGELPRDLAAVLRKISLTGTQSFTIDASAAAALDNLDYAAVSAAFAARNVSLPATSEQVLINIAEAGRRWFVTNLADDMRHYSVAVTAAGITVTLDPQLYLAPQDVEIARIRYTQGFFLNGVLDLLGFRAAATITVSTSNGIAADGTMTRLVIGPPRFFTIENSTGADGPKISIATYSQPSLSGPYQSPHALVDGQLTLLGFRRQVFVSIGESGFEFAISGDVIPGTSYDLTGHLTKLTDMSVQGAVTAEIGKIDLGPLGQVDIGPRLGLKADIGADPGEFWARFSFSFDFMDRTLNGTLNLDITTEQLQNLSQLAATRVRDLITPMLDNADDWARAVVNKIVTGVEDITRVLTEVFHMTLSEAEYLLDTLQAYARPCAMTAAQFAL